MSNKWLHAAILAGKSHVDVRSACSLYRVLHQLRRKGSRVWDDVKYTPSWTFRKWLEEHGWNEVAPWPWETQGLRLCLRPHAQLQRQLHNLRSGWRGYCWSRPEAVEVGNVDIQAFRRCVTCAGSASESAGELSPPDSALQSTSALGLGPEGRVGRSFLTSGSFIAWWFARFILLSVFLAQLVRAWCVRVQAVCLLYKLQGFFLFHLGSSVSGVFE